MQGIYFGESGDVFDGAFALLRGTYCFAHTVYIATACIRGVGALHAKMNGYACICIRDNHRNGGVRIIIDWVFLFFSIIARN